MGYEEYKENIRILLEKDGFVVTDEDIVKRNDVIMPAIMIGAKDTPVSCVFYDKQLIDMYGAVTPEGFADIVKNNFDMADKNKEIFADELLDSDNISFMVLEKDRNTRYLSDKVWRDIGLGFVLVPYFLADNNCTADITKKALRKSGISADYIINRAIEKACETTPADVNNLMMPPMTMISNSISTFGAAAFFYEGVANDVRSGIGDYYLIPSSIHEVIAVSKNEHDAEGILGMIYQANRKHKRHY